MRISPKRIPRSFTHQKSSRSRKKKLSITAKRSIGQKSSFICSQVDSFTPENAATKSDFPVKSYKKCKTVPRSDVTPKPTSCQRPIDFFINFTPNAFYDSIFAQKSLYAAIFPIFKRAKDRAFYKNFLAVSFCD